MDQFRVQLQRISEQLGGLSASQKMLTLCLVAIMVITLMWWGRYAATPEMVPVFDCSMSADDISRIRGQLIKNGITPRIQNDRILVSAEHHLQALATLTEAQALPTNSVDAWDELVKKSSPWESAEKTSALFNRAKEKKLSQVLSAWRGVQSAEVLINPTSARRIGSGGNLEPSASVIIKARPDAAIKHIVDSAALTVANSVSGLKVSSVSVVINERSYRPRDPTNGDEFIGGEQYAIIQQLEERYINKIRNDILPVPNALVTVAVDLDTQSGREIRETYDAKNTLHKEISIETETSETQGAQQAMQTEPGAVPNLPMSIDQIGTATGGSTNTERNRTEMRILPSKSVETINRPGGGYKVTRASVRLPMSHFVSLYKRRNPAATSEPTDAQLEPLIAREVDAVRLDVVACCGMTSDENVTVSTYDDLLPPLAAAVAETRAPVGSVAGAVTRHAKEIAIGVLAVVSLFMVSTMVRKNPPAATVLPPIELREATPLATDEDIAGEVGEGGALLDGMELDEDTIKAQQMVEQVATMVKENPEAAAGLVKRWLNRS